MPAHPQGHLDGREVEVNACLLELHRVFLKREHRTTSLHVEAFVLFKGTCSHEFDEWSRGSRLRFWSESENFWGSLYQYTAVFSWFQLGKRTVPSGSVWGFSRIIVFGVREDGGGLGAMAAGVEAEAGLEVDLKVVFGEGQGDEGEHRRGVSDAHRRPVAFSQERLGFLEEQLRISALAQPTCARNAALTAAAA